MNIAEPQARSWSPKIIALSVIFHAALLYVIAISFQVIPPPIDISDPPVMVIRTFTPPPPITQPEAIEQKRPEFQQRQPRPSPVPVTVPPTPLPPIATPQTEGTPTITMDRPIAEQPITKIAIRYPKGAEERQLEGRVVLSITIMPDGSVRDIRVVNARPVNVFEDSAIQSVSRWRYRPSNVIRTNVIVEIDYVLT